MERKSKNLHVSSGLPRGPCPWTCIISGVCHDLPEEVDCQVALFADDTLMYQTNEFSHDMSQLEHAAASWNQSSRIDISDIDQLQD